LEGYYSYYPKRRVEDAVEAYQESNA
jgi:hypothetical protein